MLIKLIKISFTTVGHPARVDKVLQDPIWINPSHIIAIDLKAGPEQCPDITRIFLTPGSITSGNSQISVLETPEQIIERIKATQS